LIILKNTKARFEKGLKIGKADFFVTELVLVNVLNAHLID